MVKVMANECYQIEREIETAGCKGELDGARKARAKERLNLRKRWKGVKAKC